jgi:hypothetical protein
LLFWLSFPEGICFPPCHESMFATTRQQIPSGNDNQKSKNKSNSNYARKLIAKPVFL